MFLPAVTPYGLEGLQGGKGGMKIVMLQPREQGSYKHPALAEQSGWAGPS